MIKEWYKLPAQDCVLMYVFSLLVIVSLPTNNFLFSESLASVFLVVKSATNRRVLKQRFCEEINSCAYRFAKCG